MKEADTSEVQKNGLMWETLIFYEFTILNPKILCMMMTDEVEDEWEWESYLSLPFSFSSILVKMRPIR